MNKVYARHHFPGYNLDKIEAPYHNSELGDLEQIRVANVIEDSEGTVWLVLYKEGDQHGEWVQTDFETLYAEPEKQIA